MMQIHSQARTTPAVRADFARSTEPTSVVAKRYGISDEAVRKWRKRGEQACQDRSSRPKRYSHFLKALISVIWNEEFAKKLPRLMALNTLKTTREVIGLTTLGKRIAERRLVVGAVEVPRSEGKRRTPSKQALLDELAKASGQW